MGLVPVVDLDDPLGLHAFDIAGVEVSPDADGPDASTFDSSRPSGVDCTLLLAGQMFIEAGAIHLLAALRFDVLVVLSGLASIIPHLDAMGNALASQGAGLLLATTRDVRVQ